MCICSNQAIACINIQSCVLLTYKTETKKMLNAQWEVINDHRLLIGKMFNSIELR